MDRIIKEVNGLLNDLKYQINNNDYTNNTTDLNIIKFILIENILHLSNVSQLYLIKLLVNRIKRIRSRRNNIFSKVNNLRKFLEEKNSQIK